MKTTLIFIGLKIVEISTFLAVFHGATFLGEYLTYPSTHYIMKGFMGILFPLAAITVIVIICFAIWELIQANIRWAKKLSK